MSTIEWEQINQQTTNGTGLAGYIFRAKVPNGWLVKEVQDTGSYTPDARLVDGYYWTSSITFIPDFEHLWVI